MIILALCQKLQHWFHLNPPPQKHTYSHILLLPSSLSVRHWKTQTRSWSSTMFDAFLNSSGLSQVSGQRKDLICCNLISGQNHTAYLSNIKYLPFSLSGHLAKNREKKGFYFISCIFLPIYSLFIWHLKGSDLSSNYTLLFWKKGNVQVPLGDLRFFWAEREAVEELSKHYKWVQSSDS